jgi:GTP cyclohydrolase I
MKGHDDMETPLTATELTVLDPMISTGVYSGLGKMENVVAQRSADGPSRAMLDGVRDLILGLGEDPDREGLIDTPKRVANMLREVTSGYVVDLDAIINGAMFDEAYDEPIVVKDMTFYSMCEHHMLPFYGKAHVAYIPKGRVVGLSKIPRVVEAFSRRLQVQERLTSQIADFLDERLEPQGVAVVLEGVHLCAVMRGVSQPTGIMRTQALRGAFRKDSELAGRLFGNQDS